MSTLGSVVLRDVTSARPAASIAGRLFFATDTHKTWRDNGSAWEDVTDTASVAWGAVTGTLSAQTDLQTALDDKLDDTQLDTDGTLAANSDAKIATQKAVKTYVGASAVTLTSVLGITIDGGGSAITTGAKGYLSVPFACTITGWDIVADQTGSISIEVDKHAGSPPNTTTDKISASSPVALSSAQIAQGGSISGWTTAVAANDVIGFNVASASTVTRVTVSLKVTRP